MIFPPCQVRMVVPDRSPYLLSPVVVVWWCSRNSSALTASVMDSITEVPWLAPVDRGAKRSGIVAIAI